MAAVAATKISTSVIAAPEESCATLISMSMTPICVMPSTKTAAATRSTTTPAAPSPIPLKKVAVESMAPETVRLRMDSMSIAINSDVTVTGRIPASKERTPSWFRIADITMSKSGSNGRTA